MNARCQVIHGDSREVLKTLAENSVDSCVTDPPYALVSIVKRFGKTSLADNTQTSERSRSRADGYARAASGFMGEKWDTGETAFDSDFWREVLRVLKPGAHIVAFSGTRTYHRMACAIEDAGFEIRDQLQWIYGSGFPKSHDVSKGVDKNLGCERGKIRVDASVVRNPKCTGAGRDGTKGATRPWIESAIERGFHEAVSDEAVSDEAVEWRGWGTALKPASEPIAFARKPLSERTVAANVLRWGTGALNIDGCRIEAANGDEPLGWESPRGGIWSTDSTATAALIPNAKGRWPANVIHDGSDEVVAAFPETGVSSGGGMKDLRKGKFFQGDTNPNITDACGFGDDGSAARFFYTAKADAEDRLGSKHPTVKPVDLMQWLVRLVTPPKGLVLDCFAGTGTTGEAAFREGMHSILIEREERFVADIHRRVELMAAGPFERAGKIAKQEAAESLPLFAA